MEKFITAAGCALRISDTGKPWRKQEDAAQEASPTADGHVGPTGSYEPDMTVVLLHGYLESIEIWDDFTKLLKPHMRVVAVDLPGHGISEVKGDVHTMEFLADVVHDVLGQIGVGKCVVCGHSMGGYVALELLRKYSPALAGVILFHSVPYADTEEKRENRLREIEVVLAGKKELLAVNAKRLFAEQNRRRLADTIEEIGDQIFLTEDAGVLALLRGMGERRDNNPVLAASKVPQMFIFGKHDMYIPEEVAEDMIRRHPQASVVWLENSGHMGFIEEPKLSAEAILTFCRSLDWKTE